MFQKMFEFFSLSHFKVLKPKVQNKPRFKNFVQNRVFCLPCINTVRQEPIQTTVRNLVCLIFLITCNYIIYNNTYFFL